jgi:hypothetical protein
MNMAIPALPTEYIRHFPGSPDSHVPPIVQQRSVGRPITAYNEALRYIYLYTTL